MKRFIVVNAPNDTMPLEFVAPSRAVAVKAFCTLYGDQSGYILFEQVAVSEPTGSRDEADDADRKDSVQQTKYPWIKEDE